MRALVVLVVLLLARPAAAQCGAKRSSCSGCHDGAQASLATSAAWHRDHAFTDLCVACHGGDGDAKELAGAHAGLAAPRQQCASCHGAESERLAQRYADLAPAASAPQTTSRHGVPVRNTIAGILVGVLALGGGAFVVRRERERRDA